MANRWQIKNQYLKVNNKLKSKKINCYYNFNGLDDFRPNGHKLIISIRDVLVPTKVTITKIKNVLVRHTQSI